MIDGIVKDAAAFKAGLKIKDIITMMDNDLINDDIDFSVLMASHKAGDKIKFNILRNDENLTILVTLAK